MAFASGSRHGMSYVAESTFGTTPGSPELTPLRHNSTTLGLGKETIESDEIRNDRQFVDVRHGTREASGNIVSHLAYEALDDMIEAALAGTWDTEGATIPGKLKAGTTRRSFTIQREFADIGRFQVFRGCQVNTMDVSIEPNAMVNVTFGMWGQDMEPKAAAITGSTTGAENTASPVDTFSGTINEGGSEIAVVTALNWNLNNGLESRHRVGSKTSAEPSIARSNLTGTLTAYFESDALLAKFLNETESSLSVELLDLAGNGYKITLPRIKYNTGSADVTGEGDITIPLEFRALWDATEESQIVVERVEAA